MISARTIWRTFESCNNYSMPADIRTDCRHIEYWAMEADNHLFEGTGRGEMLNSWKGKKSMITYERDRRN